MSECVYGNDIRSEPRDGPLSGATDPVHFHVLTFTNPLTDGVFVDVLPPAALNLQPSTSDATQVTSYELTALQAFETVQVPRGRSSRLVPFRSNSPERHLSSDKNSYISIISSLLLPEIPPELHIPLSFLGEEKLQVSDADTTDVDMRSCVFGPNYTRVTSSLTGHQSAVGFFQAPQVWNPSQA